MVRVTEEHEDDLKKLIKEELERKTGAAKRAKQRFEQKKDDLEDYIKKNPWKAVGAAILIGYLLGRMKR